MGGRKPQVGTLCSVPEEAGLSPMVSRQTRNISDAKSHKPGLWNVPQPVLEGGEPLTPCPFSRDRSTPIQRQAVGKAVPDWQGRSL